MSSVDVVVPCYSYGHFLEECVESVLVQSGPRIRVLIIDDGSPDNTNEVATGLADQDTRVTFVRHLANVGHIATYNEGIQWACADYMLILSADDYLLPGALDRAAKLMDRHPEVAFTFGNAITLEADGGMRSTNCVVGKTLQVVAGLEFIELSGAASIVPTPTAVVRTRLQQRVGGYRPELPHTADMEMWLRLAAHGSVGMLNAYQAVYRRHATNMSLAYMTDGLLPDIQQRKAALDCFFQTRGHVLPNAERLHREFSCSLGQHALDLATSALDEGKLNISEELSDFALRICPRLKGSSTWERLAFRRSIGYEV